jgi:hypothetical protein
MKIVSCHLGATISNTERSSSHYYTFVLVYAGSLIWHRRVLSSDSSCIVPDEFGGLGPSEYAK